MSKPKTKTSSGPAAPRARHKWDPTMRRTGTQRCLHCGLRRTRKRTRSGAWGDWRYHAADGPTTRPVPPCASGREPAPAPAPKGWYTEGGRGSLLHTLSAVTIPPASVPVGPRADAAIGMCALAGALIGAAIMIATGRGAP